MGNRALLVSKETWENKKGLGVYMQWNGGRDSVEPILAYCKLKGCRSFNDSYGVARLCQVLGNFFGGTLSVGVDYYFNLNHNPYCDNGVYVIDNDWNIVERAFFEGAEQAEYDFYEVLKELDESMPEEDRIGLDFTNIKEVEKKDLKVGDEIYKYDELRCHYTFTKIEGVGTGFVNGTDETGNFYVGIWGENHATNPNNYLHDEKYFVKKLNKKY